MSQAVCEKLPWDTAFFGINIARVVGNILNATTAPAIDTWCAAERIACVYFLARSDDPATLQTAESHGYRLVDVRVEMECQIDTLRDGADATNVRPATADDLPALEAIARVSFTDSRFYADAHFPREKCEALYVRWIQESVREFADVTLVTHQDNQATAFVTCRVVGGEGHIGLLGVNPRCRGKGLGAALLQSALTWFAGHAAPRVTVITQGRNIASQRLYQRHGFLTKNVGLYFHKHY